MRDSHRLVSRTYVEGQVKGVPMLDPAWLDGGVPGLIALSGGAHGDVGQALLAGAPGCGAPPAGALARHLPRPLLSRGAPHRARGRGGVPRPGSGSRLRVRRSGGRYQFGALPPSRRFRSPRSPGLHPGRPDPGRSAPCPALLRAAVPARPARDGRALRRPAGGGGEQRGDRPALQPGAVAGRGPPAGLSGACGDHGGGVSERAGPGRSREPLGREDERRRSSPASTRPVWRWSSTSSPVWDSPATSSSSPTLPAGRGRTAYRSAPAAARGRDRWWAMRFASPISTR